ncbi:ATP-dependent DNA helicase [Streptomyces colonosanans]|uniref:DNA 3'-5' helicase n=1 Tax=Streptomyces colonosanans TaxID=1428652 RepID=A0A1S2PHM1_9ACTN|nr:ATP-dependent DNA helicase [Streptomyces colonosanans]OIJ93193.1 ATP-dependent DNA helicase [Streptomyces colonosanans]
MPARITDPEQLKELLGIPFTPEQTACITAPPAPQVIVAGAGSGKTTVMAARVVWLVGTGQVAPEQVLGLTFTNKAAGELAERVRKALVKAGVTDPDVIDPDNPPGEPVISTYHAFAGRLLTDHGLRVGLEPTSRLLADATRYQLAARVLREAPGPYPALTRSFPDLVSDLLALDSELAEHLVRPEDLRAHDAELLRTLDGVKLTNADLRKVPETAAARRELAELVDRYRAAKRERDLLDFGDQIALSATLAGLPEVGRVLRDEFRVVLLDEYQDTSVAQRVLLAGLFGDGTGHPVTAVGDPCQAIYGWRGASVANLDDFPEHFPHADGRPATRQALSENRRSGGRLLDLANGLAEPLRAMHAGVEALRPAPGAERDGQVRCALLRTHAEEIGWIADSIAHLVDTGTAPGEIAVLCRTATDFAEIQGALVARDIPVEVVGLSGLLHLPEVADLVAVCEVLQDPGANASLVRLLTGPRWRIGPRDLALLGRRARLLVPHARVGADDDPDRRLAAAVEGVDPSEVMSLADALDTFLELPMEAEREDDRLPFSPDARVRFARLAAELRELRRCLADPLMDVLHRVLAVTGLEVELSASPHALAARRRETLSNFLDIAATFAANEPGTTLLAFLGFLRTAAQYEKGLDNALPGGENTVKVLTAHKSKGLEWDVVAVPGLVTGTFPSTQGREKWTAQGKVLPHALRGDADTLPDVETWDSRGLKSFHEAMKEHQLTEELRLGYVTFTRPRSLLLGSGHWWGPAQKRPRGPSDFLQALHDHCAAGYGEIEAWAEQPAEDEENPALREDATDHAWPLPLDEAALARRRAAAETVLAHLERMTSHDGAHRAATHDPSAYDDPEWPPPPEDEDLYEEDRYEEEGPYDVLPGGSPEEDASDWDSWTADRPADPPHARVPGGDDTPAIPRARRQHLAEDAPVFTPEEAHAVASWDRDLDALTGELQRARARVTDVPLPPSLTASQVLRLAADPDGFAQELARPMPRPPQPAARRGTRFHAWVEARFEELMLPMLEPEELPGTDAEIADERDLETLKDAFERTPYAHRTPYRVEAPFQLALAGRVVRGRIDAVYRVDDGDGTVYEIVDWKTGRTRTGDPLQLALYRLAWAEQQGVPLEAVRAAFLYVRTGEVVHPEGLLDRAALERLLQEGPSGREPADQGVGAGR